MPVDPPTQSARLMPNIKVQGQYRYIIFDKTGEQFRDFLVGFPFGLSTSIPGGKGSAKSS